MTTGAVPHSQAGIWSSYRGRAFTPTIPGNTFFFWALGDPTPLLLTISLSQTFREPQSVWNGVVHCASHISLETQLMNSFPVLWPPVSVAGERADNKPTAQHLKACVRWNLTAGPSHLSLHAEEAAETPRVQKQCLGQSESEGFLMVGGFWPWRGGVAGSLRCPEDPLCAGLEDMQEKSQRPGPGVFTDQI